MIPPKQTKRATGTVGEGAAGKKAKATQHSGGQSVSEKSQVTRTSKNVFEKSNSKTQYFVREVKGRRMTKNGVEFLIGWRDFPLDKDDTWEPITNLPGSENMIAEFQRHWEEQYKIKTSEQLQSVIDKRNTLNEKNAQTQHERNTAADMDEARADGDDDDEGGNSEDDHGEYEDGAGSAGDGTASQTKRRQTRSFYFTTGAVKRMQSKEDGSLTATCQVDGYAQCSNIIPMSNGGTQGVAQHFLKYHTDLNVRIRSLKVLPGAGCSLREQPRVNT